MLSGTCARRGLNCCADEDQDTKATRDPVAPAQRSEAAQRKALTHRLADGIPAHNSARCLRRWRPSCATPAACQTVRRRYRRSRW
jgi:hypothetical protein